MSDPVAKFSGGWFDNILAGVNTGLPLVAGLLSGNGQPKGCLIGQVSGDEAMENCIPQVYAMFDQLAAQKGQMTPEQYLQAAQGIAALFSDNKYFDQKKGGRSRELLTAAKAEGARRVSAIQAEIAAAQTGTTVTTDPVTGQTVIASNSETGAEWISGVPNIAVLAIGGGIAALLILKK